MLKNIKIYTSDGCWNQILSDLGANIADTPADADVMFDDIKINAPLSVNDLEELILAQFNNSEIITRIFGHDVELPALQRKIVVTLYKKPNIQMRELRLAVGLMPNLTTHSVENAIYQLRKVFGRDFIINEDGGYKIGRI